MRAIRLNSASAAALANSPYAVLFGVAEVVDDGLRVVDHRTVAKNAVDSRVRGQLLGWAMRTESPLVEAHTHAGGDPACMSTVDLRGLAEWVPHIRWRLGGVPYAAVVLAETTIDALAWTARDEAAEPVEIVFIGSTAIRTTARSYERIHKEAWHAHQ